MTLACEDGQQVEAHKVILAASSPFFQRLLVRNKQAHPIIYMRGLKSDDILAIVDFLYRGEANVCQANLNSFLAIADELQLNGLVQKTDQNFDQKYELPKNISQDRNPNIPNKIYGNQTPSREHGSDGTVVVQSPGNLKELDERVMSMIEKSVSKIPNRKGRFDVCKVCGKEGERTQIKDHIEANHLGSYSKN